MEDLTYRLFPLQFPIMNYTSKCSSIAKVEFYLRRSSKYATLYNMIYSLELSYYSQRKKNAERQVAISIPYSYLT